MRFHTALGMPTADSPDKSEAFTSCILTTPSQREAMVLESLRSFQIEKELNSAVITNIPQNQRLFLRWQLIRNDEDSAAEKIVCIGSDTEAGNTFPDF